MQQLRRCHTLARACTCRRLRSANRLCHSPRALICRTGRSASAASQVPDCQERGSDLLTALTGFVNIALSGHCPREVAPIFFGSRLFALEKKSGGTQPIAIGLMLRRLASKCANSFGVERLKSSFSPRQLGVGIPGGCDTAVHLSLIHISEPTRPY